MRRPTSPTTIWSRWPASAWSRRWSASIPTAGSRSPRSRCRRSSASSSATSATPRGRCTSTAAPRSGRARSPMRSARSAACAVAPPRSCELAEYLEMHQRGGARRPADRRGLRHGLARRPAHRATATAPVSRLEAIGDEDDRLERVDEQATIFAAAQHLPERERQILFLRFSEDLTQTEIADRVGVSQMQVSRLLRRSLQRLRELTDERPPAARVAASAQASGALRCCPGSSSASPPSVWRDDRRPDQRGVLEHPAGGVLVAVAGVLLEVLLGQLEALGHALAGLDQRRLGRVDGSRRRRRRRRVVADASVRSRPPRRPQPPPAHARIPTLTSRHSPCASPPAPFRQPGRTAPVDGTPARMPERSDRLPS